MTRRWVSRPGHGTRGCIANGLRRIERRRVPWRNRTKGPKPRGTLVSGPRRTPCAVPRLATKTVAVTRRGASLAANGPDAHFRPARAPGASAGLRPRRAPAPGGRVRAGRRARAARLGRPDPAGRDRGAPPRRLAPGRGRRTGLVDVRTGARPRAVRAGDRRVVVVRAGRL